MGLAGTESLHSGSGRKGLSHTMAIRSLLRQEEMVSGFKRGGDQRQLWGKGLEDLDWSGAATGTKVLGSDSQRVQCSEIGHV